MTEPALPPADLTSPLDGPDAANQNSRAVLKEKWARTPLLIAMAIPLLFIIAAFVFMGLGIFKDQDAKAPSASDAQTQAAIAELRAQVQALKAPAAPTPPATAQTQGLADAPAAPVYSDPSTLARLSQRIDDLEARQREVSAAASALEAAASLQRAARSAQPFSAQLTATERAVTDPSPLTALRPHAEKGVLPEAALVVEFPAYAAKAHATVKAPDDRNSVWTGAMNILGSIIYIRPLNRVEGSDVDAILRRAELRLNQGDLTGAVSQLDSLPAPAQRALSPWLDQARARVLIDQTTRQVFDTALKRLSATTPQTSATMTGASL